MNGNILALGFYIVFGMEFLWLQPSFLDFAKGATCCMYISAGVCKPGMVTVSGE